MLKDRKINSSSASVCDVTYKVISRRMAVCLHYAPQAFAILISLESKMRCAFDD